MGILLHFHARRQITSIFSEEAVEWRLANNHEYSIRDYRAYKAKRIDTTNWNQYSFIMMLVENRASDDIHFYSVEILCLKQIFVTIVPIPFNTVQKTGSLKEYHGESERRDKKGSFNFHENFQFSFFHLSPFHVSMETSQCGNALKVRNVNIFSYSFPTNWRVK